RGAAHRRDRVVRRGEERRARTVVARRSATRGRDGDDDDHDDENERELPGVEAPAASAARPSAAVVEPSAAPAAVEPTATAARPSAAVVPSAARSRRGYAGDERQRERDERDAESGQPASAYLHGALTAWCAARQSRAPERSPRRPAGRSRSTR